MSTPSRSATGPNRAPITSVPPAGPAIPQFTRVDGGFHPGEVKEVFMRLVTEINGLRQHIAHLTERGAQDAVKAGESPAGHRAIADLMRIAAEEIEGERAKAAEDAARAIADATAEAEKRRADARNEASSMMSGAAHQAGTVLEGARQEAKGMLDQASAKATAVDLAAGQRMDALNGRHQDTVGRLRRMHEVIGGILDAEDGRGTLDDEVARALPPGMAVAGSIPQLAPAPEAAPASE